MEKAKEIKRGEKMKNKIKSNRSAIWDFENLRVSIPVTNEMSELVKKALDNNIKIVWKLKVEVENERIRLRRRTRYTISKRR